MKDGASRPGRQGGLAAGRFRRLAGQPLAAAAVQRSVSAYVTDIERMPADLAISQLKMSLFRGVCYLDGGWTSLVQGLSSAALATGASMRAHRPAAAISSVSGGWRSRWSAARLLQATAVVVAVGGPAAARQLLRSTRLARPR